MIKFFQKRIVKDAFLYTSSNFIIQLSSFLGILIISRYLGPTKLGFYSFVQNYITAFVTIISGFDTYANWSIVHSENYIKELLKYVKMKAIIVLILSILFLLFSFSILPRDIFFLTLILIIPTFTNIFASYSFILQYQNKAKFMTVVATVSSIFLLFLKIIAVFFKSPLIFFIAINSIDGLFLVLLCYYYLRKIHNPLPGVVLFYKDFLKLFTSSFFAVIYMSTWYFLVRVDQFLVPLYFDAYTLGLYSSAVKLVEMSNVLVVIMQSLVVPRVLLFSSQEKDLKRTKNVALFYLFLGASVACIMSFFSSDIIKILFGDEYSKVAPILSIYAWSIPGLFVTYFFTVLLLSKRAFKQMAVTSVALSFFTFVLTFAVATTRNIYFMASLSIVTYSVSAFAFYLLWKNKVK